MEASPLPDSRLLGSREVHPAQELFEPGFVSEGQVMDRDAEVGHIRVKIIEKPPVTAGV